MKRLRGQAAIDAAVEREVGYARVLGWRDRLAFYERILPIQRSTVEIAQSIVDGDYHRLYASRGERWRDTYRLRRDQETVAESEAIIVALKALERTETPDA